MPQLLLFFYCLSLFSLLFSPFQTLVLFQSRLIYMSCIVVVILQLVYSLFVHSFFMLSFSYMNTLKVKNKKHKCRSEDIQLLVSCTFFYIFFFFHLAFGFLPHSFGSGAKGRDGGISKNITGEETTSRVITNIPPSIIQVVNVEAKIAKFQT